MSGEGSGRTDVDGKLGALSADSDGAVQTKVGSEGLTTPGQHTCPECKGSHLSFDSVRGELFCEGCGFVIEDKLLDERPEWAAYSHEDEMKMSRVGPPIKKGTLNSQLSTVIMTGPVDSKGSPISPRSMSMYYRLGRLQRQVARSGRGERSVGAVSRALSRLASQLQLPPSVVEEASFISMKAIKSDLLRGRSIQALVSASLYIACRNLAVPRTINEISTAANIGRKRLTKTVSVLSRKLGFRPKPAEATDYVARFCSELSLGEDVRVMARSLLSKTGNENSLSPPGTAASAIYLSALARGQRVPQKRVARVAGISEVTLRSHFKLFRGIISFQVPRGRASPSNSARQNNMLSPGQAS